MFWSTTHVGYEWPSRNMRGQMIGFSAMLSMFADRIGARADTLLQQINVAERRDLPLSIALRETTPPAALQQYIWNDAATGGMESREHARDKVRAIERLYTDENWARINTVHASGQGKVRMALIKDDIGNWNLKSFDQDPTELLNAYKSVGLAGLKAATDLIKVATGSAGGAAAIASAFQLANQITGEMAPGGSPTIGSRDVAALRQDLITQLEKLRDGSTVRLDKLREKKEAAGRAVVEARTKSTDSEAKASSTLDGVRTTPTDAKLRIKYETELIQSIHDKQALEQALATEAVAKNTHDRYSDTIAAEVRDLLGNHEALINALDRGLTRQRAGIGTTQVPQLPQVRVPAGVSSTLVP